MLNFEIKNNEQFKITEILFDGKPSENIRNALKSAGYRWHGVRRIWYGYKNADEIAEILKAAENSNGNENSDSAEKLTESPKNKNALAPLWDRTRTDDLPGYGTPENYLRKEAQKEIEKAKNAGGKYCGYDKAVAIVIRRILRERFPEVKFSVTSGGAGYLNAVDICIKSSPYARNFIKGNPQASYPENCDRYENSLELNAVLDFCNALHDSFDDDDGDHWGDYGAHHDLYGRAALDWKYEQTVPTEEQTADMKAFAKSAEEQKEKEHTEFLERCRLEEIERKKQEKEAEERRKIEEQQAAEIVASVNIVDLDESEQIVALDFITGCGKEGSIKHLKEVIDNYYKKDGEEINANDLIISRKIIFNDRRIFENFSALLWRDWEFLACKGCTESEDERLKSIDYYKLTKEQRETVKTFSADCVGVYLNDCLQYVIDPQGYTYARYIYIPRTVDFTTENGGQINAVIKLQSATEYRAKQKADSEKKKAFYIPAPLKEQAEQAALKEDEPITMVSLDDMIMTTREARCYIVDVIPKKYAQYDDALTIVFNIKGKRGEYVDYLHNGKESVIYRGHLPAIPESLQYTDIGGGLKQVNYSGMSAIGYIKRVIEWYEQQGFKPVIDTVAR